MSYVYTVVCQISTHHTYMSTAYNNSAWKIYIICDRYVIQLWYILQDDVRMTRKISTGSDRLYKVLVLGDQGVGKTALLQQFTTSEYMGAATQADTVLGNILIILIVFHSTYSSSF